MAPDHEVSGVPYAAGLGRRGVLEEFQAGFPLPGKEMETRPLAWVGGIRGWGEARLCCPPLAMPTQMPAVRSPVVLHLRRT